MYFQYDSNGTPFGFVYNNSQYFYLTNQMGDVVAIANVNGFVIAEYNYDEWGKLLSIDASAANTIIATANPLRYRGYYYDDETGYYYLQSRYYDADICRFINADVPEIAQVSEEVKNGVNIFAYCNNNPTNDSDPTGKISLKTINNLLGSFFNLFTRYLKNIFNKISKKIGINQNKVWFSVSTKKIATAINVISGVASFIKGFIISFPKQLIKHGLIVFLKSYLKSSKVFTDFVKKEFLPNILKFAKKIVIETIVICASIQIGKQKISNLYYKALDAVLRSKALNNIAYVIDIFSSTGNIIGFILDCFDGTIDDKLVVYKR